MKKSKKKRHIISIQLALICIAMVAGCIFVNWLINVLFLGDFYLYNKCEALKKVHTILEDSIEQQDQSDMDYQLQSMGRAYDVDVVVVDVDNQNIIYGGNDPARMRKALWDKIFLDDNPSTRLELIEQTTDYQICISRDVITSVYYLEMWGSLKNDDLYLIQSPLESIEEGAKMSNRFLVYIAFPLVLICGIIVMLVTIKVTKPIFNLIDISERVSHLDFDAKYTGNSRNELGELGDNINKMSESLERNITDLKLANIELKKDIEAKEAIEAQRGELISNISHELKTPIAIIQGYAEGIMEGVIEDRESLEYYCNVIHDESIKMNNMVKKLLTLNELESGANTPDLERFDIVTMINNRMHSMEALLNNSNINYKLYAPEALYVWGDEFRVEEVLTNIVSNAINHCSGDNVIEIKAQQKEDKAFITIYNTGEHIPEEAIPHIFEKFYKVDKARTREYGGSGIGLSIVKAIQDSMGQDVFVNNVEGGVAFTFTLDAQLMIEE